MTTWAIMVHSAWLICVMRHLTPYFDVWLLTTFKPHPALFPLYPTSGQADEEASCSFIWHLWETQTTQTPSQACEPLPRPYPNHNTNPGKSPFTALKTFQTCPRGLSCSPQRVQVCSLLARSVPGLGLQLRLVSETGTVLLGTVPFHLWGLCWLSGLCQDCMAVHSTPVCIRITPHPPFAQTSSSSFLNEPHRLTGMFPLYKKNMKVWVEQKS